MAQRGWSPEDADELRAAIGQFVRAGRSHDVVPPPQAAVLGFLDREGPLTIAELAERSQVRHQTMRVTIGVLQDEGAVSVSKSETDGRKVFCALTAVGRDLLDRDRDTRTRWILRRVEQRLSADQQAVAHQIAGILRLLATEPGQGEAADLASRPLQPG
jgi:DNA-binding MarR family transcriptional regulator